MNKKNNYNAKIFVNNAIKKLSEINAIESEINVPEKLREDVRRYLFDLFEEDDVMINKNIEGFLTVTFLDEKMQITFNFND